MDIDFAIHIAELWNAGKMIGGDEDEVRNTLLNEIKRLRIENENQKEQIDVLTIFLERKAIIKDEQPKSTTQRLGSTRSRLKQGA